MPQRCKVCDNPERLNIDRAIISGKSLKEISREFNIGYDSLYRHSQDHLSRQLSKAYELKQMGENNELLEKIESIISRAEDIFRRNYEANKDLTALKSLAEIRSTIELLHKISYQSHQARLAELELERLRAKDDANQNEWAYIESLHVLTDPELNLFGQLMRKLKSGNKNHVIRRQQEITRWDDFTDFRSLSESIPLPSEEDSPQVIPESVQKKISTMRRTT